MNTYDIDIPLVDNKPPLTLNQRLHWTVKNRITRDIRQHVAWQAKTLKIGIHYHITVELHFATGDNRHRDADNLVATLKPAIDGLVDAHVILNDTPEHLTWHPPTIHKGPNPRRLWITITPTITEMK